MLRWKCVKYTDESVLKYLLKLISAKKKKCSFLISSPVLFIQWTFIENLLSTWHWEYRWRSSALNLVEESDTLAYYNLLL